jgi:hypothetical protein
MTCQAYLKSEEGRLRGIGGRKNKKQTGTKRKDGKRYKRH